MHESTTILLLALVQREYVTYYIAVVCPTRKGRNKEWCRTRTRALGGGREINFRDKQKCDWVLVWVGLQLPLLVGRRQETGKYRG